MNRRPLPWPALWILALAPSACEGPPPADPRLELTLQSSGTEALLQAVSAVDDGVAWVSGHRGTWARTTDGGATWAAGVVEGADTLQFRDVQAFDSLQAVLMSAGPGSLSRLFVTRDGGGSWRETHVVTEADGFLDCMAFWDRTRGLVYGDAVAGVPYILLTRDGGESWTRVSAGALPAALPGEGGFAASGTCAATGSDGQAWIATGNGPRSRLLATRDFGASWQVVELPLVAGEAAGATTVEVDSAGRGFVLGGVIGSERTGTRVALSSDRGVTWEAGGEPALDGAVYGAAWIPGLDVPAIVAVGPGGMDWSVDGGRTWTTVDTLNWWAVGFAGPEAGWAVGPGGRLARLRAVRP